MSIRKLIKNFRNWCPQPPNPLPTKLKRYSMPIAAVITVTLVFSVSFSILSPSLMSHPSVPIVPLINSPSSIAPTLIWNYTTDGSVTSKPAVAEGTVYFTAVDHGRVYALSATDGANVWGKYSRYASILAPPAVANGTVYICYQGGTINALNAANGSVMWSIILYSGTDIRASPVVANGLLYVGSGYDDNVYAIDATDGSQLWNYTTSGPITSSPAVVNDVVYVSSSNDVYALKASNGEKLWNHPIGDGESSGPASSPVVVNGVVYVGSTDHKVYALNADNGKEIWSFQAGGEITSTPAVDYGVVYIGSNDHNVYALNAADGTKLWSYTTGDSVTSTPAIAGGIVYVGSLDGNFYALAAADGSKLWGYFTGNAFESPIVLDNKVYVGSGNNIYAFNIT